MYGELNFHIAEMLQSAGCDSPAFDADCLLQDIGGLPRGERARYMEEFVPPELEEALLQAAKERAQGRPLQYILGNWDFLNLTLKVGEGVLIPRPETELLCEIGAGFLRERALPAPKVLDLCAGSGCVGLGVASLYPAADVTAVELSDEAFVYLCENCDAYRELTLRPVQLDVLTGADTFEGRYDLLLSNPPYIPSAVLPTLQREVQREPRMALDGDVDGLRFYRAIADGWLSKLTAGGLAAVEVGIGQAQAVAELFEARGLREIRITPDASGIDRVVSGQRIE